ncbi:hypothetical protein Tco_0689283 [Tanacetum coccineum]
MKKKGRGLPGYKKKQALSTLKNGITFKLELKLMKSLHRDYNQRKERCTLKLKKQVKEKFTSTEPTEDKEREIWIDLKRLFEPDTDDELWKLQKHIHDITWRLYDTCGVHHVSTKDGMDIYMLVEREYPLSRGVLI